jgi:iron complex transport system substrate-binding protein
VEPALNHTEHSFLHMRRKPCQRTVRCITLLWCLLSCGPLQAGVTVIDDTGQAITLARPAHRIVSLAPNITELLFAAGAGLSVVGASEFSDYPQQAGAIPRIGGAGGLDLEAIAALQPDLVIAWDSGNPASQVERLRALGLPVFHSEPRNLQDIPRTLRRLAQLAGTATAAQPVIDAYARHLQSLHERYAGRTPVRVFYQVWERPLMTINGAHMISDVLHLCGGENIFADQPVLSPQVSIEAVLARDPEAIIIAADRAAAAAPGAAWRRWAQLQAVRNAHVYTVQRELLVRQTPRILDGAERLCELLEQVRQSRPDP